MSVASMTQGEREARLLNRTAAILNGDQSVSAVSVIIDACSAAAKSENDEIAYCAIALAAFDSGRSSGEYNYQLATLYFRDQDKFISLLTRIPEESRAPVVVAVVGGSKDIVGDPAMKTSALSRLTE